MEIQSAKTGNVIFQGKYMEILFWGGQPVGGRVRNFLLEKSRVVKQNSMERNFHVFYQILAGMDGQDRNYFGVMEPDYYSYLNEFGCYQVNFHETFKEYVHCTSLIPRLNINLV